MFYDTEKQFSKVEVRGPCRPILPFMDFLLMKRLQKKRWIEQYGEYPISVKRSRSNFRAKCRFDDPN